MHLADVQDMKVLLSDHAVEQSKLRGATHDEILETISTGERSTARHGRMGFRKNFPFGAYWNGKHYETKQVLAIVAEEDGTLIVVTVFAFYFGAGQ
jgi:hypothetical protein